MDKDKPIDKLLQPESREGKLTAKLEKQLADEKDARREERFIFIVTIVILFNIVFFTVTPSFGGLLALLVLELLILIPLARRMAWKR